MSSLLCFLPCSFLFEFLSKYDAISSLGWLPWLLVRSFLFKSLFKYNAISSPGCLASAYVRFLLNPYLNMMRYLVLAALPPPVIVSLWIPIQIWCNILSWLPSWLPSLLVCSFLFKSLFKYNAISSPGCLASACVRFSLNFYSNMTQHPLSAALLAALPRRVFVPYQIMIQIWCDILSWLPCLRLCLFLIKPMFKYDAISCPRCFASSCVRFFLNPYPNMMQYHLLAALLAALPPRAFVPG